VKLRHEFRVPLDAQAAWDLLLDIETVATCFPGARLTEADGDSFKGNVSVRLGPIAMDYRGTAAFISKDHRTHVALIEARGTEAGGAGSAGADVRLSLFGVAPGVTNVVVDTDLAITGRPAQFGRGVISEVSDNILKQFTRNLEVQLLAPSGRPVGPEGPIGAAAPDLALLVWRPLLRRALPLGAAIAGGIALILGRRVLGRRPSPECSVSSG
jgi:carbon monoxide dehydrogenase subunit G